MFVFNELKLAGCFEIRPRVLVDLRGSFIKVFNKEFFHKFGLESDFVEDYFSNSKKSVIRGMHFQIPPKDHAKIVYCTSGAVFDVIIDLRVGSPTYGKSDTIELNSSDSNMIYLPRGIAHGFYVRSDEATLIYKTTSLYSNEHDKGVLWSSVNVDWPKDADPIISGRDLSFPLLSEFKSPFVYDAK